MTHTTGKWRVKNGYDIYDQNNYFIGSTRGNGIDLPEHIKKQDREHARFIVACRNAIGDCFTIKWLEKFEFGELRERLLTLAVKNVAYSVRLKKAERERDELTDRLTIAPALLREMVDKLSKGMNYGMIAKAEQYLHELDESEGA